MTTNPLDRRRDEGFFVGFQHFAEVRLPVTHHIDLVVPDEPGLAHAVRMFNHWDKPALDFFTGLGVRARCGLRLHVRTAQPFPADDPDACPICAALVTTGKDPRPESERPDRPRPGAPSPCSAIINLPGVMLKDCTKSWRHDGPHRTSEGETWESGREGDYTPAPDGFV